MLLLDIAYPASAASLIGDCQAAGAPVVGLYILNQSLPGTVRDAGFVQAVRSAGVTILPIIVPGNNPPGGGDWVIRALQACGFSGSPVAIDLEAGSLPFSSWVSDVVRRLLAAGYRPWIYATSTVRRIYGDAEWWQALWDNIPTIYAGSVAHQYGGQTINGRHYDASASINIAGAGGTQVTESEKWNVIRGWYSLYLGLIDGVTADDFKAWAGTMKADGTNLDEVHINFINAAKRDARWILGKVGPQGPKGDTGAPGPQGPAGPAVGSHEHQLSGVAK